MSPEPRGEIERLKSLLDEAIRELERIGRMGAMTNEFRDYRGKRNTQLTKQAEMPAEKWRD